MDGTNLTRRSLAAYDRPVPRYTSYPTAAKLERASGLPVIGSITEVVTPDRHLDRRKKLVWLAGGGGALVGLYALLLVAEFIQRGMVA